MNTKQVSEDKLKTLRDMLPHGSSKIISEKLGIRADYISRVLHGREINTKVLNAAVDIAIEQKNAVDKVLSKIDML